MTTRGTRRGSRTALASKGIAPFGGMPLEARRDDARGLRFIGGALQRNGGGAVSRPSWTSAMRPRTSAGNISSWQSAARSGTVVVLITTGSPLRSDTAAWGDLCGSSPPRYRCQASPPARKPTDAGFITVHSWPGGSGCARIQRRSVPAQTSVTHRSSPVRWPAWVTNPALTRAGKPLVRSNAQAKTGGNRLRGPWGTTLGVRLHAGTRLRQAGWIVTDRWVRTCFRSPSARHRGRLGGLPPTPAGPAPQSWGPAFGRTLDGADRAPSPAPHVNTGSMLDVCVPAGGPLSATDLPPSHRTQIRQASGD